MFYFIKSFSKVCVLIVFCCSSLNSQLYNQNDTILPFPYQSTLGLPTGQRLGTQNLGIQPVGSFPYSFPENILTPPNATQQNNYYAMLAQQGRPAYQYPLGYPQPGIGYGQPGMGYPQPGIGYPQPGIGYPQPALGYPHFGVRYPSHNYGYLQPYQQSGGLGHAYPGIGYPYQNAYPPPGQGSRQQHYYDPITDPYINVKADILDVSPEYHRQVMGWPSKSTLEGTRSTGSGDNVESNTNQENQNIQPRYNINIDSKTSNFTNIPSNLTKPIITTKKFTTSIRRTFVYDSSNPGDTKAINLHFVNGEEVTTIPPPTTTENEEVEGFTIKGRRFMDVPTSCPKGTMLAQNGKCIEPFFTASLAIPKNFTVKITTQAPEPDENEI